jgi:hypothetical protein
MSKAPRIILFPFSPVIFPKKFLKKGFAFNTWPQYPVLKWLLMGPFVILIILTIIPLFFWAIGNFIIYKSYDTDKCLQTYERFLKIFANMGFGNSSDWKIENDYRNPNSNEKILKILYLKTKEISIFEKIDKYEFWKYADKVWVYKNDQELLIHLKHQPFDTNGSIWVKEDTNKQACTFSYLNEVDEKIQPIIKHQKEDTYYQFQKQKQRHPKIHLHPNDILPPEIVYYYEPSYEPLVNQCIQENITRINDTLAQKGLQLMYWPRILLQKENLKVDALQYASYTIPTLGRNEIESIVKEIQIKNDTENILFKIGFEQAIGMPTLDKPCFIRCVEDDFLPENKKYTYSVFPLTEEPDETILQKINFYCKIVGKNDDGPQYRLVAPDESDPDEYFSYIDRLIDPAAKLAIDSIKKLDDQKMLISSMAYMINSLKESHPDLCKKLNSALYDALSKTNNTISRLVIDEKYRIFLPDFNNLEIELGPLPKTVFIFLLKHPEGVLFKDLRPHSKEIKEIYTKVGNRLDMDQIDKSIKELTDPRSNSINEKCSRIKEAFVSKIDNSIAQQYYVTGSRSSKKGIQIDRTLVQFPQTK